MAAEIPRRPRLADHVLARRHVQDGRECVILHDEARRETMELDVTTWAVLSCADGTRDVEGIVAAAARLGAPAQPPAVTALLRALAERDALQAGAPAHAPDVVTIRKRPPGVRDLPVVVLPGYRYACDGSGGCCQSYGSVLLTPEDRDRARAALPDHRIAGIPSTRWFTPDRGSAPTPLCVPLTVEGGCGFLGADGLCEIHREVGLAGKPRACAAFPVVICCDGVELRVSVMPECACVLRPVGPGEGDPIGVGWQIGADVPGVLVVDVLPETIRVEGTRTAPRAWLRAAVAGLYERLEHAPDPAELCWSEADAWSEPKPRDLAPYVEALHRHAKDTMRRRATYAGKNDWVLRSLRWLVGTLHLLADPSLQALVVAPTGEADPIERRYLQAALWSYQGFDSDSAAFALRLHAVRVWIARAMSEVPLAPSEHAIALASLNMLLRGHALARAWQSPEPAVP